MRDWLKKDREKVRMTHEQVADKASISRSYYTNIENGTKTPSVKAAKSIALVLGFPWEKFFNDKCYSKEHFESSKQKNIG
ncbi:helix-turn-helix transcriptional regulator [Paenibacillus sp. USDA918EY]|uniref:helix-turn-helix transcriptional regulator n=1 Tax=Paenibacillus sp. USDA918EY TaxID=2689575 RepID=UPI00135B1672|nr:helix-turn-helix transcriptional regulator [Paenibacillus sp. USDA918EY]